MLREWLRGTPSEEVAKPDDAKPVMRMVVDAEQPLESCADERAKQREAFEKKLKESAVEKPAAAQGMLSYETLFRNSQGVMLEGSMNEVQEGININIARNVQNTMLSSKWTLATPQTSNWEITAQMNGFNDIIAASWSTLNRYQLLYQRMPLNGALIVAQFMAQKQRGMVQGNVFGMMQYPWLFGGCTQVQYIKDQSFSVSHLQRLVRGLHVGSNLTLNPATRSSTLSHVLSFITPNKDASFLCELTPAKGSWRLVATAHDWGQNMDAAMQLEYNEGQEGMASLLSFGCRKKFIGGAQLTTAISAFNQLRASLSLPFGGEVPGVNQLALQINCQYDVHSGKLRQGLSLTS